MASARRASIALAVAAVLTAAGCASGSGSDADGRVTEDPAVPDSRPGERADHPPVVVQVPAVSEPNPFLDPAAEPTTDLGRLRARYLPVWTPDFDWAFPPVACGTAWELDGIAEPTSTGELAVLGDFATAAVLSVMRYEHQYSGALVEPSSLAQLCVATTSVRDARTDALDTVNSYVDTGVRRAEPAAFPEEVWIVGASPAAVMSVACVEPGYPTVVSAGGSVMEAPRAPGRLQAYLLMVSMGLEDQVPDLSYRVSHVTDRPAEDCSGLHDWALEWDEHVQEWTAEGQLWESLDLVLTADDICANPPPEGPDECPRAWPR